MYHAICNIIEPLFDKIFIYDSHANGIGKGAFKAIKRFDKLKPFIRHVMLTQFI